MKKLKARPKPETECFYYKGNDHWKQNYPKYLADKKDGKVNKGIFDIHVIDVCFTSVYSDCRCENQRISGRGSQTMRLRLMVIGGGGHDVYQGSGPLHGGNTLLPA